MFALHWICALTLAICLNAQPVKRDADELLDMISTFKTFFQDDDCAKNIRLHSPSDIKKECNSSAWNCVFNGLSDLQSKCNINEESYIFESYDSVLTGLNSTKPTTPSQPIPDCRCENYNKTDVGQFLYNLEVLVQRLGSE